MNAIDTHAYAKQEQERDLEYGIEHVDITDDIFKEMVGEVQTHIRRRSSDGHMHLRQKVSSRTLRDDTINHVSVVRVVKGMERYFDHMGFDMLILRTQVEFMASFDNEEPIYTITLEVCMDWHAPRAIGEVALMPCLDCEEPV